MAELSDAQQIERVLGQGDEHSFSQLVTRHYASAYHQACALVGDWVEAQDLVQEAFLKVHARLHTLRDPSRFGGWLRRIVHSTCMEWHRSSRRRPQVSADDPNGDCPLEGLVDVDASTPLDDLLQSELLREIRKTTDDLPARYRLPLTMYHFDQLSYEAVAEEFDVSPGTARSLVSRARRMLQGQLRSYLSETPVWHTIAVDCNALPSRQGWTYRSGYEFLPGGPAEERVFSARGGVLTMDNADLFPDNHACYCLYGVVDPGRPLAVTLRARKLRETARFPEFRVSARDPHLRNGGLGLQVCTGTEKYCLYIGHFRLQTDSGPVWIHGLGSHAYHTYRLEITPGTGYKVLVDDVEVASGPPRRDHHRNHLAFGDLTASCGNAHAEIRSLRFAQLHTVEDDAGIGKYAGVPLSDTSPFLDLGFLDLSRPTQRGRRAEEIARELRRAIQRYSSKWQLRRGEAISEVDFSPR